MRIVPVILGGGAGSRLWPLSRETFPKPFVPLPDGETLLRKTYARLSRLSGVDHIVTVLNRELVFLALEECELAASGVTRRSFISEPFGRDTAAAVALACLYMSEADDPETIMLVAPSDHLVREQDAFEDAVQRGADLASQGRIVVFGTRPTHPETAFGYVEAEGDTAVSFVEKPGSADAEVFLASGRFFWNAGMFCFRAGAMLESMEEHCPQLLSQARSAYEASVRAVAPNRVTVEVDRKAFAAVAPISIDYAVMEKADALGFVACDFTWSDIGSWAAISELLPPDENGNRTHGAVLTHDTSDTFVHGDTRLVGLIGISNLLVIDTPDALMIAERGRAQEVKGIYERLKAANAQAAILHRTVHRPWGTHTVIEEGDRFKIKRIEVKPGASLSLQAHHHRSEHWVVVRGAAKVTRGEEEFLLTENQSTYIPSGHRHRLENPGKLRLVMIEVQSGEYLGEDDIVRFEDVYGRVP